MNKYKLIIFDLIDTLAEPKGLTDITATLVKELGKDVIEKFIDGGNIDKLKSVEDALQKFRSVTLLSKQQEELVREWLDWSESILFDDTIDVLESLKEQGYVIGVISNSPPTPRDQLSDLGIKKYIDESVFSYEVGSRKPEKEIFISLLERLKIKAEEALMIGDSIKNDIEGANAAGINAILLDRNNSLNYQPKIASLRELRDFL